MHKVKCVICTRVQSFSKSKAKYLDRSGDYICSPQCLLEWVKYAGMYFDITKYSENLVTSKFTGGDLSRVSQVSSNLRSFYEEVVGVFFHKKNIRFAYELFTFKWGKFEYTPDFYLLDFNCFVEVKGLWMHGTRKKYRNFRLRFPDVPLIVAHWNMRNLFPRITKEDRGFI